MVRTRTLSKDLERQTTWKGPGRSGACGARWATRVWITPLRLERDGSTGPPARLRVHRRTGPRVSLLRPRRPHQPAGGVVDHAGQIAVPLRWAISSMPIRVSPSGRSLVSRPSATTRATIAATVRHAMQRHGEHAQCSVGGKPRAGVFKAQVCFAPGRPRATTTPCSTRHPQGRGLQISLGGPDVQVRHRRGASPPRPPRRQPGHRFRHRRRQPACDALGRTGNTSTSVDLGRRLRPVVSVSSSRPRSPCSGPRARSRIPWTCATP